MGTARQIAGIVFAFAVLAPAGCSSRSRLATDPPTGLPPLDIGRDVFDSGAGRSANLDPPPDSAAPAPEWPTQPPAGNVAPPAVNVDPPAENVAIPQARQSSRADEPAPAQVATPRLCVGIEGARAISPGDAIPLEVHVSNSGAGPATNVKLRADFDIGLIHESGVRSLEVDVGTLAPGQTQTVPLTLTAAQAGKPVVQVTASGDGGLHAEAARTITVAQRAMQFTLNGAPTRYVNRPGPWDMRVANTGDAPLTNVTARVRLPRELRFQSATGNGQFAAGEVVWKIGDLRPGERRELQVTATPVAGAGEATLTGLAAADKVPAQSAEVAFEVMGMPALRADIVPPAGGIPAGGKGVVTVRVTNQGTLAARNVIVAAVAPTKYLSLRFGTGPTVGRVQGERVQFLPVARIEPEQTITFQIEVAGAQPGDGRLQVEVRSETSPTPLMIEDAIRVTPVATPGRLSTAP